MADEYMGIGGRIVPSPGVAMTYRQVQPAEVGPFLIPLVGGKWVKLFGTFPLTQEAWDGFLNVLNVMAEGLVEAESLTAESESVMNPDYVLADYIKSWPMGGQTSPKPYPPRPPAQGYPLAQAAYEDWVDLVKRKAEDRPQ